MYGGIFFLFEQINPARRGKKEHYLTRMIKKIMHHTLIQNINMTN